MVPENIIENSLSFGARIHGVQNQLCLLSVGVSLVKQLTSLVLVALDFSHQIIVLVLLMSQGRSET